MTVKTTDNSTNTPSSCFCSLRRQRETSRVNSNFIFYTELPLLFQAVELNESRVSTSLGNGEVQSPV
jgi:hypothetical protein